MCFGCYVQFVPDPLDGPPDDLFIPAAHIAPGGIDIVYAEVEGGPHYLMLRCQHGAEADNCHLQAGPAEGAVDGRYRALLRGLQDSAKTAETHCRCGGRYNAQFQKLPPINGFFLI